MDEAEIYMKGWKISKIVHMITRPQIRPEGDQTKIGQKEVDSNNHNFNSRKFQLGRVGKDDTVSAKGRLQ